MHQDDGSLAFPAPHGRLLENTRPVTRGREVDGRAALAPHSWGTLSFSGRTGGGGEVTVGGAIFPMRAGSG